MTASLRNCYCNYLNKTLWY